LSRFTENKIPKKKVDPDMEKEKDCPRSEVWMGREIAEQKKGTGFPV